MSERPIVFSAPEVRALLDGRKSQTRQVIKLPTKGEYVRPDIGGWEPTTNGGAGVFTVGRDGGRVPAPETIGIWNRTTGTCLDARYQIGDRLFVKEALGRRPASFLGIEATNGVESAFYRADDEDVVNEHGFNLCPWWKGKALSPIHLPRWASRLTLTVTSVRVERLQDISEADARAEGHPFTWDGKPYDPPPPEVDSWQGYGRASFSLTWSGMYGPGAWERNPWLCALTFDVHRANIDALRPPQPDAAGDRDGR